MLDAGLEFISGRRSERFAPHCPAIATRLWGSAVASEAMIVMVGAGRALASKSVGCSLRDRLPFNFSQILLTCH